MANPNQDGRFHSGGAAEPTRNPVGHWVDNGDGTGNFDYSAGETSVRPQDKSLDKDRHADPNSFNYGGSEGGRRDAYQTSQNAVSEWDRKQSAWRTDFTNRQNQNLSKLRDQAGGQVQGTQAQQQLAQQSQNAQAAQYALAQSARGTGAMANAGAASDDTNALTRQQVGNQSAQLASKEQLQAQQQYAQQLNQVRGQNYAQTSFDSGLDAEMQRKYEDLGYDINTAGLNGSMARDKANSNIWAISNGLQLGEDQIQAQRKADEADSRDASIGTAIAGAGSLVNLFARASDRRVKRDIRDGSSDVAQALDGIDPKTWHYKGESNQDPLRVGIIAQDIERTPVGRDVVRETPRGKVIDGAGGLSFALAGLAELNDRIRKLEGSKRGSK